MARHDPNVGISPNLLSNFNPFDILEPQKCDTVPAVAQLVDVGDFPLHKDVNASLLDQKSNYTLVDLFENMYVTARHVKIKKKDTIGFDISDSDSNCTTISSGFDSGASISSGADSSSSISSGFDRSDSVSSYDDEAFKHFCDKIESGKKIDWIKDVRLQKEYDVSNQRDLPPKIVKEVELDPEDVIYEVLSEKTSEKRILDEIRNSAATTGVLYKNSVPIDLEFPKLKVLKSPNIDFKAPVKKTESATACKAFETTLKNKTKTDVTEASRANLKVLNGPIFENRMSEKNIEGACCQTCKLSNSSIKKNEIDIMIEIGRLKINNDLFYDKNVHENTQCSFNLNVTKVDFTVIAIKKNEKEYKKRRIAKPESLTSTYSNGADFDEKSIVLPKIMARINARKTYLQEKSMLKKRLVLDSGIKPSNIYEINKNSNDNVAKPTNSESNSSTSQGIIKCSYCFNIIKSTMTDINSAESQDFGQINPTVLMEDCNKERLMALKKSQEFKAFVHGK